MTHARRASAAAASVLTTGVLGFALMTGTAAAAEPCIGFGCSPEQDAQMNQQEAQAHVHAVGESVPFLTASNQGTITLTSTQRAGSYLVVDLTVRVKDGNLPLLPASFTVQDGQGRTYHPVSGVVSKPLGPGPVTSGQTTSGQLAFNVPAGPAALTFGGVDGFGVVAVFEATPQVQQMPRGGAATGGGGTAGVEDEGLIALGAASILAGGGSLLILRRTRARTH